METKYSVRTASDVPAFTQPPTPPSFNGGSAPEQPLPPPGHRVIVLCSGYRCLGYLDEHGVWRTDARNDEIENVKGWTEFE